MVEISGVYDFVAVVTSDGARQQRPNEDTGQAP